MKLTKEQARTIQLCSNNFYKFTTEIFSQSTRFDDFKGGDYVKERCNRLAKEKRTIDIAARSHFKSTSLYSYILWKMMYGCLNQDLDIRYFSFNKNLSSFHIREIKSYRTSNPFFEDFIDYKPLAESIITGSWNRKHKITVKPHGLMSFSRGIKTDILCIDDPFKDPENPLKPTAIKRINYIFKSVLLKSVRKGGEIHVVGTPLSYADFTLDPKIHKTFSFKKFPGIVEENGKEVPLWPEFYTVKELKDEIPIMGEKIWQREIMCEPYYSEESYFKKSFLRKNVVNKDLSNIPASQGIHTENRVVAGLDIGKKKHPAGISVFEIVDNKAIMRHWRMVKGWPYFTGKPWNPLRPSLLEYCKELIKNFNIDLFYVDNTRSEFDSAEDQSLVPECMKLLNFTFKNKNSMATNFQKIATNKQLELIEHENLLTSISQVTNDLIAIETKLGHGEMFWSVALAMLAFSILLPQDLAKTISSGGQSIFDGGKLPENW